MLKPIIRNKELDTVHNILRNYRLFELVFPLLTNAEDVAQCCAKMTKVVVEYLIYLGLHWLCFKDCRW